MVPGQHLSAGQQQAADPEHHAVHPDRQLESAERGRHGDGQGRRFRRNNQVLHDHPDHRARAVHLSFPAEVFRKRRHDRGC